MFRPSSRSARSYKNGAYLLQIPSRSSRVLGTARHADTALDAELREAGRRDSRTRCRSWCSIPIVPVRNASPQLSTG